MVKYIEEAVQGVMSGKLDAITTCPINKQAINELSLRCSVFCCRSNPLTAHAKIATPTGERRRLAMTSL
jgi:hypothetical protein